MLLFATSATTFVSPRPVLGGHWVNTASQFEFPLIGLPGLACLGSRPGPGLLGVFTEIDTVRTLGIGRVNS